MRYAVIPLLLVAGCGAVAQPDWIELTGAYGLQTDSAEERAELLQVFEDAALATGNHVDAASDQELAQRAQLYRQTVSLCMWKGSEDDEMIACASDYEGREGLVYITMYKGTEPEKNDDVQDMLQSALNDKFGSLPTIPIMPNGSLPLARELILEGDRYQVSEETIERYELDAEKVAAYN